MRWSAAWFTLRLPPLSLQIHAQSSSLSLHGAAAEVVLSQAAAGRLQNQPQSQMGGCLKNTDLIFKSRQVGSNSQ